MAAVRDTLCKLRPVEIPRPKCAGLQFVATRGRFGFYQSIKRDGEKYGIQIKSQGPRRPTLPDPWLKALQTNDSPQTPPIRSNGKVETSTSEKNGQQRKTDQYHGQEVQLPKISEVKAHNRLVISQSSGYYSTPQHSIVEEPEEHEPEPDYEPNGTIDRSALPTPHALPAPPLPTTIRNSIVKPLVGRRVGGSLNGATPGKDVQNNNDSLAAMNKHVIKTKF